MSLLWRGLIPGHFCSCDLVRKSAGPLGLEHLYQGTNFLPTAISDFDQSTSLRIGSSDRFSVNDLMQFFSEAMPPSIVLIGIPVLPKPLILGTKKSPECESSAKAAMMTGQAP